MNDITKLADKAVFVVGYPKSGTTLLTAMLDNHEELLVIPEETRVFSRIWRLLSKELKEKPEEQRVDTIVQVLLEESKLKNFSFGKVKESIGGNFDYSNFDFKLFREGLSHYFLKHDLNNKRNLSIGILSAYIYAEKRQVDARLKYWVEKTPRHYEHVEEIKKNFPEAKILHIIRDPRDNWVSYKKKKGDGFSLMKFLRHWRKAYRFAYKNKRKWPEDVMVISYERLVANTIVTVKELRSFLKISHSDSLLIPSKRGKSWSGNSMWGEKNSSITNSTTQRYLKWPNQKEIRSIETILKKELSFLMLEKAHQRKDYIALIRFRLRDFKSRVKEIIHYAE